MPKQLAGVKTRRISGTRKVAVAFPIRTPLDEFLSKLPRNGAETSLIAGYIENAHQARESAEARIGAEREFV